MVPKQRLCGESLQTVSEPLLAAVDRSLDPTSEWHERRDVLHKVIRSMPAGTFDEKACARLKELGILPTPDAATTTEGSDISNSSSGDEDEILVGCEEARRYVQMPKYSTKNKKAFRCRQCRFAWVECVSALCKRKQRDRRCLCESGTLPHKFFFTRNNQIDLKNIQTLLDYKGVKEWRVVTDADEFKNSRITVKLQHKQTEEVQNVVLRPLLAGETTLVA